MGKKLLEAERLALLEARLLRNSVPDIYGCRIWKGQVSKTSGYGKLSLRIPANVPGFSAIHKNLSVHRVAYEVWVGPIPSGHTIDHDCEAKLCIEPTHLISMTQKENNKKWRDRRAKDAARGMPFRNIPSPKDLSIRKSEGLLRGKRVLKGSKADR